MSSSQENGTRGCVYNHWDACSGNSSPSFFVCIDSINSSYGQCGCFGLGYLFRTYIAGHQVGPNSKFRGEAWGTSPALYLVCTRNPTVPTWVHLTLHRLKLGVPHQLYSIARTKSFSRHAYREICIHRLVDERAYQWMCMHIHRYASKSMTSTDFHAKYEHPQMITCLRYANIDAGLCCQVRNAIFCIAIERNRSLIFFGQGQCSCIEGQPYHSFRAHSCATKLAQSHRFPGAYFGGTKIRFPRFPKKQKKHIIVVTGI